jgi:hypothetical protein
MSAPGSSTPGPRRNAGRHRDLSKPVPVPTRHPYLDEIESERAGWYELVELIRPLTVRERVEPGYYRDPEWAIRDVVGHIGTWLAEAHVQFERIGAGSYEGHDVDIDGLNASFLEAMQGQPWNVAMIQANAGRTMMLQDWYALDEASDEAAWWIRKSAAEHYAEHLGRLREWVAELLSRRPQKAGSQPST